jgi:hypothetical protein
MRGIRCTAAGSTRTRLVVPANLRVPIHVRRAPRREQDSSTWWIYLGWRRRCRNGYSTTYDIDAVAKVALDLLG